MAIKIKNKFYNSYSKPMTSPSRSEIDSDEFNALWEIIKTWDISVPEYYSGYTGGNGSHVKLILDGLRSVLRNKRISSILNS